MSEDDLTLKQKMWIVEYLKTGNATQAALKAYETDDPVSAASIGHQNFIKLHEPVKLLMEARGLSLGKLLDVLSDGLGATRTISIVSGKQANGGTVDFEDVPDFMARHKYLETAGKWLGIDKSGQTNIQTNIMQVEFLSYEPTSAPASVAGDSDKGQS